MSGNLYELPVEGAEFTAFCGGNLSGEHESCLEFAAIPGAEGYVLRDTKAEGAGRELRVTEAELRAFVHGAASRLGVEL